MRTSKSQPQRVPSKKRIVQSLLERHGRTFCDELYIDIARNTPGPLFKLLCASILLSARIRSEQAMAASAAIFDAGWTTPRKLVDAGWDNRVQVLNSSGYARYDESSARMLGETAELLEGTYRGDLRRLREEAGRDPAEERRLLKRFKGLGDTGVDIFFREVQGTWDELHPFADRRSLASAAKLGLPEDAKALSRLVDREDFPRLVAALVRTALSKDAADILDAAALR